MGAKQFKLSQCSKIQFLQPFAVLGIILAIFCSTSILQVRAEETTTPTPTDSSTFSEDDTFGGVNPATLGHTIVTEYFKFNIGVINSLANGDDKGEENISEELERSLSSSSSGSNVTTEASEEDDTSSSEEDDDEDNPSLYAGSSAGSSFGLGQLLATVRELRPQLPTSTPGFETLLKDAPDYLTDMYQLVISATKDLDFMIDTKIFTSQNITNASFLEQLNAELFPIDFKKENNPADLNSNVIKINDEINAKLNESQVNWLEGNYIPKQMTLPSSTKVMLVHTLILSQEWYMPWKPIGKKHFQDHGLVEMLELTGNFPYLESDRATEVSIPLKNDTTRVLSLILPRNIQDALNGNLGEAHNGTAQRVRIQIPAFNFTFRVPHDGGVGGSECNFEKQANFMNILDDLTLVKFSEDRINAIAITGVHINNVADYKEELKSVENSKIVRNSTLAKKSARNNPDAASAQILKDGSEHKKSDTGGSKKAANEKTSEKLIVFDRPFTWTIIDDNLFSIPIFSGAMESFVPSVDLSKNERFQNRTNVFGLDRTLRYLDCL